VASNYQQESRLRCPDGQEKQVGDACFKLLGISNAKSQFPLITKFKMMDMYHAYRSSLGWLIG
jgi:hypothetical protein